MIFGLPSALQAAEIMTLSITPLFYDVTIAPGDSWTSSIKVTNPNPYEVAIALGPHALEPADESGHSTLLPLSDPTLEGASSLLANWISLTATGAFVGKEQSVEVPFTIRVPKDAPAGGHYAAIIVETKPGAGGGNGASASVVSGLSALVFVRVPGDVIEAGEITNFSAKPTLALTFQNTGTTHLRPQGVISIFNIWDKEVDKIFINQDSPLGYVLHKSSRTFSSDWRPPTGLRNLGRYKAIATLTYGNEARQNVASTTYFWVVPVKQIMIVLGIVLVLLAALRKYIKKEIASLRDKM